MNNNYIVSPAANGTFLTINDLFMPVYLFHLFRLTISGIYRENVHS